MSVDRYLYIVRPKSKLGWRTPRHAFFTCVIIWASMCPVENIWSDIIDHLTVWSRFIHTDHTLSYYLTFADTGLYCLWDERAWESLRLLVSVLFLLRDSTDCDHRLLHKFGTACNQIRSKYGRTHGYGERWSPRSREDTQHPLFISLSRRVFIKRYKWNNGEWREW